MFIVVSGYPVLFFFFLIYQSVYLHCFVLCVVFMDRNNAKKKELHIFMQSASQKLNFGICYKCIHEK